MTSRLRRRSRGQAIAEFALIIPLFLLILMALFDLGRAVFINNGLTNAAREAARLAIVNQDSTLVAQRAQAMAFGVTITTTPDDLVAYYRSNPDIDDVESNEPCDNSDADHEIAVGCVAVVTAEADWQPITPIVGNIVGQMTFSARSELPIEFVCPSLSIPEFASSGDCPKQP
jgi:Flp pilus assembly protein TadG